MERLVWNAAGSRFYETGIDQCVVYIFGHDGVAWGGLTAIKEAPTGGSPSPYYQDGIKYANVASSEEFEATIEAISSPLVFGVVDGTANPYQGLYVTQQPRKSFGLSYRTMIGNDIDGLDHGYKLHLVYNALAEPTSRENASLSDSINPAVLSWHITTIPEALDGHKPTAHFIIDSRYTPSALLLSIEDMLYGTDVSAPYLPEVSELIALFESYA